jgi:hypothetical protein
VVVCGEPEQIGVFKNNLDMDKFKPLPIGKKVILQND